MKCKVVAGRGFRFERGELAVHGSRRYLAEPIQGMSLISPRRVCEAQSALTRPHGPQATATFDVRSTHRSVSNAALLATRRYLTAPAASVAAACQACSRAVKPSPGLCCSCEPPVPSTKQAAAAVPALPGWQTCSRRLSNGTFMFPPSVISSLTDVTQLTSSTSCTEHGIGSKLLATMLRSSMPCCTPHVHTHICSCNLRLAPADRRWRGGASTRSSMLY